MGLYLGLPQDNYPGRRPQAPACFKYLNLNSAPTTSLKDFNLEYYNSSQLHLWTSKVLILNIDIDIWFLLLHWTEL